MAGIAGDCVKADEAEEQVIKEVRKLGQETLQDWANGQNNYQTQKAFENTTDTRPYKKNSIGIQLMEG